MKKEIKTQNEMETKWAYETNRMSRPDYYGRREVIYSFFHLAII